MVGLSECVLPVASSTLSSSGKVCFCSHLSETFCSRSEVSSNVLGLTVFFPKMSSEFGRLGTAALSLTPEGYSGLGSAVGSFFTEFPVLTTENIEKK